MFSIHVLPKGAGIGDGIQWKEMEAARLFFALLPEHELAGVLGDGFAWAARKEIK